MFPVNARAVYIKSEAAADARSMARIGRMLPFVHCATAPVILDDAGLNHLVREEQPRWHRHGLRAEQVEPVRRRVALKLIKPGMDSRQVIGRFEAERQALAGAPRREGGSAVAGSLVKLGR